MEYWNDGILGLIGKNLLLYIRQNAFKRIIPKFHASVIPVVSEAS